MRYSTGRYQETLLQKIVRLRSFAINHPRPWRGAFIGSILAVWTFLATHMVNGLYARLMDYAPYIQMLNARRLPGRK